MKDLSGLTFEAGTRVDPFLFPGVVPPVSVPSFPSRGARATHPFLSAATVPLANVPCLAGSSGTQGR